MGSGGGAILGGPPPSAGGGMLSSRHGRLGFLSMGLLVFQGTALSLTLRYSRARDGVTPYLASVAVVATEAIKLVVCALMHAAATYKSASTKKKSSRPGVLLPTISTTRAAAPAAPSAGVAWGASGDGVGGAPPSPTSPLAAAAAAPMREAFSISAPPPSYSSSSSSSSSSSKNPFEEVTNRMREVLATSRPMAVPAALFVAQQILVIVAASHLDAVTFQICAQSFKIVPTALFAVWLLGQALTPSQWASLPVLALGTVFVTLNGSSSSSSGSSSASASASSALAAAAAPGGLLIGLSASILSGLSSAYAGVYFERYVKGRHGQSLWVRNLQLSLYGTPFAACYALLVDGRALRARAINAAALSAGSVSRSSGLISAAFEGFDAVVWGVVALQVGGGLVVGMVVKYADNIQKNFANALSVALTVLGAAPLFGLWPSPWFLVGVAATLLSVSMYSGTAPPLPEPLQRAWDYFDRRLCPAWLKRAGRDVVLALGLDRGGLHGLVRRTSSSASTSVAFVAAVAAANSGVGGNGDGSGGGGAGDIGGKRSSLSALENGNGGGIGGGGGSDDDSVTREHGVSDSARRRARIRVCLYSVVLLLLTTLFLELRGGGGGSGGGGRAAGVANEPLGRRGGGGSSGGVQGGGGEKKTAARFVGVGLDAERHHPAHPLHHGNSDAVERVVPGDADGSDRGHQRAKKQQRRFGDELGGRLLLRRLQRRSSPFSFAGAAPDFSSSPNTTTTKKTVPLLSFSAPKRNSTKKAL